MGRTFYSGEGISFRLLIPLSKMDWTIKLISAGVLLNLGSLFESVVKSIWNRGKGSLS
jgi:hypothetical protein